MPPVYQVIQCNCCVLMNSPGLLNLHPHPSILNQICLRIFLVHDRNHPATYILTFLSNCQQLAGARAVGGSCYCWPHSRARRAADEGCRSVQMRRGTLASDERLRELRMGAEAWLSWQT
eukprot:608276-Pelagomonas_calceolata.AAC.1